MNQAIISILLVITIAVPLFFDGHLYSVFDLSKITVLYIFTFLLVALWAIRGGVKWNILGYPILAILFSTIISTVFAVNPYLSLVGTYKRYGGLISTMVYMVLFFAVVHFVNRDRVKMFINVIILTASVASVYAIIQYIHLDPYNWTHDFGYKGRPSATFGHPTFFGAYMAMTLPLALYGILAYRGKRWMYPVAGLLMYALFISKTRSAFVGLIVAMIYFFVLYRKKISLKIVGLVIAVIVGLSFIVPHSPVKRLQYEMKHWHPTGNIAYRLRIGMACLDISRDYPVAGIGLDCLGIKYPTYYENRYKEKCAGNTNRAHNTVLNILLEQGIIGLLAWAYFIVIYFRMVLANRDDLLVIALSSGVVAYMVQNLFSFSSPSISVLFWFLIGMTVISTKEKGNENRI